MLAPGAGAPSRKPYTPIEKGSESAAWSMVMPAGMGKQEDSGMTMYSDRHPSTCPGHPRKLSFRHVCGRPARH